MLCERCENNEAVMQVSIIEKGKKRMLYICKDCAGKMMGNQFSFLMQSPFQMMSHFWGDFDMEPHQNTSQRIQCPVCGLTYQDFMRRGRFGCSHCYDTFREQLIPLFKDLHYAPAYCGKIPNCADLVAGKDKILILTREKEAAVAREDYERAAQLQSEILALKGKGGKG